MYAEGSRKRGDDMTARIFYNRNVFSIRLKEDVRFSLAQLAEAEGIKPRALAQRVLQEYTKAAFAKKVAA